MSLTTDLRFNLTFMKLFLLNLSFAKSLVGAHVLCAHVQQASCNTLTQTVQTLAKKYNSGHGPNQMQTPKLRERNAVVEQVDFNVAVQMATMHTVTWAPERRSCVRKETAIASWPLLSYLSLERLTAVL